MDNSPSISLIMPEVSGGNPDMDWSIISHYGKDPDHNDEYKRKINLL